MGRQRPRWRSTSTLRKTLSAKCFEPNRRQIELIENLCRRNTAHGEDISDQVIWDLYKRRGFQWSDDDIAGFTKSRISIARYPKKTREAHEDISELDFQDSRAFVTKFCDPEVYCEASLARERLNKLPNAQREILEFIADGGSPLEYAQEKDITPWSALTFLSEARECFERV